MMANKFSPSISSLVFLCFFFLTISSVGESQLFMQRRRGRSREKHHKIDVIDMIRMHGFPAERHHVVTQDGYIIELHRIPQVKESTNHIAGNAQRKKRPQKNRVVFMPHCFLCTSSSWLVLGRERALPYLLHANGFDVWMMNARGTSYGKNHTTLSPRKKKFWKFGLHEIAMFDLSSALNYVMRETAVDQVDFVGYSMGTLNFFMLMCDKPEYNKKIRKMVALSPPVYIKEIRGLSKILANMAEFITSTMVRNNNLMFPPSDLGINQMFLSVCKPESDFLMSICHSMINLVTGTVDDRTVMNRIQLFFSVFPDTTSLRTMVHFLQLINTGEFVKFSYGGNRNPRSFNRSAMYNLKSCTAPVSIIYSDGDPITPVKGVKKLSSQLTNLGEMHKVRRKSFTHQDYIWGEDASTLVYPQVLRMLNN